MKNRIDRDVFDQIASIVKNYAIEGPEDMFYHLVRIDDRNLMPRHVILAMLLYSLEWYGEKPGDAYSELTIALDAFSMVKEGG